MVRDGARGRSRRREDWGMRPEEPILNELKAVDLWERTEPRLSKPLAVQFGEC
jgi:hypothetical protein